MSGNAGLCQLAAVIIVSVEACGSAGLVSCGNTDKADSPCDEHTGSCLSSSGVQDWILICLTLDSANIPL